MAKLKTILGFLLLVVGCECAHAQPFLEDSTIAFDPKGVKFEWAVTNVQPSSNLKMFRSVPRKFSAETISNLLVLAGLTEKDRDDRYNGTHDPNYRGFTSKQRKFNSLQIRPSEGWVELKAPQINKDGQAGDLVPSIPEVIQRGSNLLTTVFSIGTNEWAYRENGKPMIYCAEGTHESNDPETKQRVKCVTHRSVTFSRAIEGCTVLGGGGDAEVDFLDFGRIYHLKLNWPATESTHEVARPSLDDCKETLTKGGARWSPGVVDFPTRLILRKVDYCYLTEGKAGDHKTFVPLVRLGGVVYDSRTNAPISLFCRVPVPK